MWWRHGGPARFVVGLVVVLALATAVRTGYVLGFKRHAAPRGDEIFYSLEATRLANGDGFTSPTDGRPAADHPPLVALSLTPAAWLSDGDQLIMRFTNVAVGVATVGLILLLARELAGDRAAFAAGGLAAVYPGLWVNDGSLMGDSLAAFTTIAVLYAALSLRRRPSLMTAFVTGALVGFATLVRAELLLLCLVVVLPAIVAARRDTRRRLIVAAAALAGTVVIILPWVAYNSTRFERPVLVSTNDGLTLAGANCDASYYGGGIGFWSLQCATANTPPGEQSQVAAALRSRAITYARHHLSRIPVVVAARVLRVWSLGAVRGMVYLNRGEGRERWVSWLAFGGFWLLVPVAVTGLRRLRQLGEPVLPFVLLAVQVTVVAAVFYGIVRFRVPFEVGLVTLAGIGLVAGTRPSRRPPAQVAT